MLEDFYFNDNWIVKVDIKDGSIVWTHVVDIEEGSIDLKHTLGNDGSIYLQSKLSDESVSLVKLEPEIKESDVGEISLGIYPNPISNGQSVRIESAELARRVVDLELVDVFGRTAWLSSDFFFVQSEMEINFETVLSSGIYFLNVSVDGKDTAFPLVVVNSVSYTHLTLPTILRV